MSDISESPMTRRVALGVTGAASAAVMSGCGSSETGAGGNVKQPEISSPIDMAATQDVPVGGVIKANSGDVTVMISQPAEGTFKAFSSACTHQGCTVNAQNNNIVCPCHSSNFTIEDGSVTGGPAEEPLPQYPVKVDGGRIIVG